MSDLRNVSLVLQQASSAAATGDYAAAERLLREAATLQEAELGPGHPDLANTLNNVGVVCDLLGKSDDAELCYRRALAIASASLDPGHEFVATSRKNLQDFYLARGRYADAAALQRGAGTRRTPRGDAPPIVEVAEERALPRAVPTPEPARRTSRVIAAAAALAVVAAGGWAASRLMMGESGSRLRERAEATLGALPGGPEPTMAAGHNGPPPAATPAPLDARSAEPVTPAPASPEAAAPGATAPPATSLAVTSPAVTSPVATSPEATAPSPASRVAPAEPPARAPAPPSTPTRALPTAAPTRDGAGPEVASAQLCATLTTPRGGRWQCDPAEASAGGRALFFYTRVKTPRSTTIQHRWYRGEQLQVSVDLRVGANASDGYRTFSRQWIGPEAAGDWRVELRGSDGAVLHEERFEVR